MTHPRFECCICGDAAPCRTPLCRKELAVIAAVMLSIVALVWWLA